jgi:hypothetical protein
MVQHDLPFSTTYSLCLNSTATVYFHGKLQAAKVLGYGKNIELEKDGRKVLWAKMEDKDPVIQLIDSDSEDNTRIASTNKDTSSYSQ